MAFIVFLVFVFLILWLSAYSSRKAQSLGGYFVANNSVHWGINGIAFAGGYLSVASFLGICGLIAFLGYDGFLYSIGFLAGWVVALFIIAEPMKRMGAITFSDALNRNFNNPGIHLAAGLSTLVISLFYLVPQMVGAGVLMEPLLGVSHQLGVILVGLVVTFIVASGGMTATTWVQFFNGGLLLTFAAILTVCVLFRGVSTTERLIEEGQEGLVSYRMQRKPFQLEDDQRLAGLPGTRVIGRHAEIDRYTGQESLVLYRLSRPVPIEKLDENTYVTHVKGRNPQIGMEDLSADMHFKEVDGINSLIIQDWWRLKQKPDGEKYLVETQYRTVLPDGSVLVNGLPKQSDNRMRQMGSISNIPDSYGQNTGPVGPLRLLSIMSDRDTTVRTPRTVTFHTDAGERVTVYYEEPIKGSVFMRPGLMFPLEAREGEPATTTLLNRLNFISLMLALFMGTAALPHILIRYYTVPDAISARRSTIIAISGIGLFYVLTMYLGVGAIAGGALHPETSNMSAPLLARSFGEVLFAMISGIAFTTVLATVSGLIMASSGAVAHDLMGYFRGKKLTDHSQVVAGKITAVVVGLIGIYFGISFRAMNVSFLVGWAFAVAASANLPALIMMLFWKKVTAQGIIASILTGIVASVGLILVSPDMWAHYGLDPTTAPMPINQPGIVSIPLSFIVLVLVSLKTGRKAGQTQEATQ